MAARAARAAAAGAAPPGPPARPARCRRGAAGPTARRAGGLRARAAAIQPDQLVLIAAEPVAKVALLSGAGALCARAGLLPPQGRRLLSGLSMNLFLPALLFSRLGLVDLRGAAALAPLAANMLAVHATGLLLGWLQVALLRVPEELRRPTLVMSTVGNVGNLPLVLVPALAANPALAGAIGGAGGTAAAAAAVADGEAYVMVGFFVACFIQFPIGYLLLSGGGGGGSRRGQARPAAAAPAAAAPAAARLLGEAPSAAAAVLPVHQEEQQQREEEQLQGKQQQQQQQQQQLWVVLAKNVFTPPVLACLAAVPVCTAPELRHALFSPDGALSAVGGTLSMLGAPLIPCLFLVLGANLSEGPGAARVPPGLLAGMAGTKLVLHPLAGLGALATASRLGLLPPPPADGSGALLLLTMLLVWASPTAVLVHSLATTLQACEDEVSAFLFVEYLSALVTLPAFMALCLAQLSGGQLGALAAAP